MEVHGGQCNHSDGSPLQKKTSQTGGKSALKMRQISSSPAA